MWRHDKKKTWTDGRRTGWHGEDAKEKGERVGCMAVTVNGPKKRRIGRKEEEKTRKEWKQERKGT